jgi:hypothetical protein
MAQGNPLPLIFVTKWVIVYKCRFWSDADKGSWVDSPKFCKWFASESDAEKQASLIEAAIDDINDDFVDLVPILVAIGAE